MGSNTTYETDPKDSGIIPRVMKEVKIISSKENK